MGRAILLLFMTLLLLSGCGKKLIIEPVTVETNLEENIDTTKETNTDILEEKEIISNTPAPNRAITENTDGSLHFNLTATTSILLKSIPNSEGVILTDSVEVKEITGMMSSFTPYDNKEDFKPEYDYTLTFKDADGLELTTLKVYDNNIISYQGETYIAKSEQLNLWKIRKVYINESKKTLTIDATSFYINGKAYNLQDENVSINAITNYSWLGTEEFTDPTLILECHINPNVGYCAIFDVEEMDIISDAFGTSFLYKSYSITTLVYAFQDSVYNYWGDILYQNPDDDYFIKNLVYSSDMDNALLITLESKQEEKTTQVSCINYHKSMDTDFYELIYNGVPIPLGQVQAELTRDGNSEIINISKVEDAGDLAYLEIKDSKGASLWSEFAHTSHAGWNSVYLCHRNNEDYLLIFNPYQSTGIANFMFTLFYLTGEERIHIVDSGYYSFSYGAEDGADNAFDEETFRIFADKVNIYLQNSYILMSTEEGVLRYSTDENHLLPSDQYATDHWISNIKENLY